MKKNWKYWSDLNNKSEAEVYSIILYTRRKQKINRNILFIKSLNEFLWSLLKWSSVFSFSLSFVGVYVSVCVSISFFSLRSKWNHFSAESLFNYLVRCLLFDICPRLVWFNKISLDINWFLYSILDKKWSLQYYIIIFYKSIHK